MRFLADESMDMRVIRALRFEGHDVRSVLEEFRGLPDEDVVAVAKEDDRVLLTEDRDFGQLLFVRLQASLGAVYIRYPTQSRDRLAADVVRFVRDRGDEICSAFVVMQANSCDRLPSP